MVLPSNTPIRSARRRSSQTAEQQQHEANRQFAYHILAEANLGLGKFHTAQEFAQAAYVQALKSDDLWFTAYILNNMGQIAIALGDISTAKDHFKASYEIREAFEDPEGMALALLNLGDLALEEQMVSEAREQYQRSQVVFEQINDKGGLSVAHRGLGVVFCKLDETTLAQEHFQQALQLAIEIDYRSMIFGLMVDIATWLWGIGQQEWAVLLLAFVGQHPNAGHETQQRATARLTTEYQGQISPDLYAAAVAKAEASELEPLLADLTKQLSRLA
jgi:tetratricopeptide (TPR) repeat protein